MLTPLRKLSSNCSLQSSSKFKNIRRSPESRLFDPSLHQTQDFRSRITRSILPTILPTNTTPTSSSLLLRSSTPTHPELLHFPNSSRKSKVSVGFATEFHFDKKTPFSPCSKQPSWILQPLLGTTSSRSDNVSSGRIDLSRVGDPRCEDYICTTRLIGIATRS